MSQHNKQNQAKRNARLAWLAMHFGKPMSDAQKIIGLIAAFPGTSEKTARQELKEVYQRFADINSDNWAEQKQNFLELCYEALDKMDKAMQYGPYANTLKTLAGVLGVITEKTQIDQTISQNTPAPKSDVVRSRIDKLMSDPKVRERAKKAGLDLDEIDK